MVKLFGAKKKQETAGQEPQEAGKKPPAPKPVPEAKKKSPLVAAVLSLIPGLGYIYLGLTLHGIVIFATSWLLVPYIYGIAGSFVTAQKINRKEPCGEKTGIFFSIIAGIALVAVIVILKPVPTGGIRKIVTGGKKKAPVPYAKEFVVPVSTATAQYAGIEINVPVYTGAKKTGTTTGDGIMTLKFVTPDPIEKVVVFYRTEMPKSGYVMSTDDFREGESMAFLIFNKGGRDFTINLIKKEDGTTYGSISSVQ